MRVQRLLYLSYLLTLPISNLWKVQIIILTPSFGCFFYPELYTAISSLRLKPAQIYMLPLLNHDNLASYYLKLFKE